MKGKDTQIHRGEVLNSHGWFRRTFQKRPKDGKKKKKETTNPDTMRNFMGLMGSSLVRKT